MIVSVHLEEGRHAALWSRNDKVFVKMLRMLECSRKGERKSCMKNDDSWTKFRPPFCQSYILLVDTRACLGQLVKLTPDFPANLLSFKENTVKIRFKNIFKAILYIFLFFFFCTAIDHRPGIYSLLYKRPRDVYQFARQVDLCLIWAKIPSIYQHISLLDFIFFRHSLR